MVNQRLVHKHGGRKERLLACVWWRHYVLYAFSKRSMIVWFDLLAQDYRTFSDSPDETMSHPPPLSSLPDDIVLRCLALVPRMYHLNISWVSKDLRSLVRSPELNLLRSTLRSLHLCFQEDHSDNNSSFHWFTLNEAEHGLVLNPTPFPSHPSYGSSSTVAVGSNIFFMGGSREPSTDLWILDTRSGNITKGPSMSVARVGRTTAVGVIDGKIYVMGGGEFNEEMQVEVFDPETETETTWELAGVEKVRKISRCSATVDRAGSGAGASRAIAQGPREREGSIMFLSIRNLRGRTDTAGKL
ncbi:hypothetical protein YC2023_110682 [Brassica napus]